MYLLAFDTALTGCSVCLYNMDSGDVKVGIEKVSRGQAEILVPTIDNIISQASINYDDISYISTTVGPGAFTGLRIGLSCAKALALSLDVPLVGLTTLEVLAYQYFRSEKLEMDHVLGVILETKRKDFYFQMFDSSKKALTSPMACNLKKIISLIENKNMIFIGDGLIRLTENDTQFNYDYNLSYGHIDPVALAECAKDYINNLSSEFPAVHPLYLRDADVSKPKSSK